MRIIIALLSSHIDLSSLQLTTQLHIIHTRPPFLHDLVVMIDFTFIEHLQNVVRDWNPSRGGK